MEFTREQYENLPARQAREFKDFVLRRFGDYTKFTTVKASKHWGGAADIEIGAIYSPLARGWSGWKVNDNDMFKDELDYITVYKYLEDERLPTSYSHYVQVPKAFIFGEMEADEDYQLYLKLKERFEG